MQIDGLDCSVRVQGSGINRSQVRYLRLGVSRGALSAGASSPTGPLVLRLGCCLGMGLRVKGLSVLGV